MVLGGPDCTGVLAPAYLSFATSGISFIFFLLTSAGNLLVCLAVYKDPSKELRTPFNVLVVNLAFADLLVGLVLEPISVAIHLKEGLIDGPLGDGIPTIHMSYFISCTASVLSLAAISVDRYIAISYPFFYRAKMSATKVAIAPIIIWIISASLPFIYFKIGYISYAFVFANTAVILTFVILVFSYAHNFRKIRKQLEVSTRLQGNRLSARRKADATEARITHVFLVVLVAYLLCYTPSCIIIYVMNFCTTCSCYSIHWLRDMQFVFVLLNSCLNPFVYAWRLPAFRSAFVVITGLRPSVNRSSRVSPTTTSQNHAQFKAHPAPTAAESPTRTPLQALEGVSHLQDSDEVVVNKMYPEGNKCARDLHPRSSADADDSESSFDTKL